MLSASAASVVASVFLVALVKGQTSADTDCGTQCWQQGFNDSNAACASADATCACTSSDFSSAFQDCAEVQCNTLPQQWAALNASSSSCATLLHSTTVMGGTRLPFTFGSGGFSDPAASISTDVPTTISDTSSTTAGETSSGATVATSLTSTSTGTARMNGAAASASLLASPGSVRAGVATATNAVATSNNPDSQSPSGLSNGAKIGVGIGVTLGALLLLALILIIVLLMKRKSNSSKQNVYANDEHLANWQGSQHLDSNMRNELPAHERPVEVSGKQIGAGGRHIRQMGEVAELSGTPFR